MKYIVLITLVVSLCFGCNDDDEYSRQDYQELVEIMYALEINQGKDDAQAYAEYVALKYELNKPANSQKYQTMKNELRTNREQWNRLLYAAHDFSPPADWKQKYLNLREEHLAAVKEEKRKEDNQTEMENTGENNEE